MRVLKRNGTPRTPLCFRFARNITVQYLLLYSCLWSNLTEQVSYEIVSGARLDSKSDPGARALLQRARLREMARIATGHFELT